MTATFSSADKKAVRSVIELGLLREFFLVVFSVAVKYQKLDVIRKVKEIIDTFPTQLDEQQKQDFEKQREQALKKKSEQFLQELRHEFAPGELEEVISQLSA